MLAEAFKRGLLPGVDLDAPEAVLAALVEKARAAWPALELDPASFVEHVAGRVQADTDLGALHAADLYLAFACLLGDPVAMAAFDQALLAKVPAALRGTLPAGLTEDDVLQSLRLKLFVRGAEAPPRIAAYSGRGALVHWLRASAVRVVQDFARTRQQEVPTADEDLLETPVIGGGAEVAYLKTRFAPEFKAAFQEAMASLSERDQNLLRLQYLDGVSPEEIGRIYQTHRTTVWRWLSQCRQELLDQTRRRLAARVNLEGAELSSLMNVVHSQLDVSLSRLLKKP